MVDDSSPWDPVEAAIDYSIFYEALGTQRQVDPRSGQGLGTKYGANNPTINVVVEGGRRGDHIAVTVSSTHTLIP